MVLGDTMGDGGIGFAAYFEQTPWEQMHADVLEAVTPDPDRVGLVLFTSGTSGEPKAALRTVNSVHGRVADVAALFDHGSHDAFATSSPLSHLGGIIFGNFLPLLVGGSAVFMNVWEPSKALEFLSAAGATTLWSAPAVWAELVAELRRQPGPLPPLRVAGATGTAILAPLVTEVADMFGVTLRAVWGATEGTGTAIGPDDPPDWAARSVGRPGPGVEIELRADDPVNDASPARVYLRGSELCLATAGGDTKEVVILAEHDDGWYDTGDLAVPDGRGGIRILGRARPPTEPAARS
ncbi:AMP-binding protein [Pseudonocardia alaniniphila]|uniref:AMP-binding protein n=1 Tax=Pseudonocardia alaniniphila TaxID=75291 RepID=A0ABS9TUW4_9PSEU|nr:AMP-binding protein [Pseudonocardia alaniniphila]MCH6172347.1 AMP-binding protein [Pseudonocardia alaniniphila]